MNRGSLFSHWMSFYKSRSIFVSAFPTLFFLFHSVSVDRNLQLICVFPLTQATYCWEKRPARCCKMGKIQPAEGRKKKKERLASPQKHWAQHSIRLQSDVTEKYTAFCFHREALSLLPKIVQHYVLLVGGWVGVGWSMCVRGGGSVIFYWIPTTSGTFENYALHIASSRTEGSIPWKMKSRETIKSIAAKAVRLIFILSFIAHSCTTEKQTATHGKYYNVWENAYNCHS